MKLTSSGTWTNLWVVSFESREQVEIGEFGLQGRPYSGVVSGRMSGMLATMKVFVTTAAKDTEVTDLLKSRALLNLESSIGQAWIVRVIGDIERKQNLSAAVSGPYNVKHEYFLNYKVVEAA